jgi:hypothetical protein
MKRAGKQPLFRSATQSTNALSEAKQSRKAKRDDKRIMPSWIAQLINPCRYRVGFCRTYSAIVMVSNVGLAQEANESAPITHNQTKQPHDSPKTKKILHFIETRKNVRACKANREAVARPTETLNGPRAAAFCFSLLPMIGQVYADWLT